MFINCFILIVMCLRDTGYRLQDIFLFSFYVDLQSFFELILFQFLFVFLFCKLESSCQSFTLTMEAVDFSGVFVTST